MKPLSFFLPVLFSALPSMAQKSKFSTPAHFQDLHTVYTYQKSNWDGSHASTISLYVADSNQLQSFKWSKGDETATLVTADLDWNRFAVKKFQNHRVSAGGKQLVAELLLPEPRSAVLQLGDYRDTAVLDSELWHSYDFDFAGLGFTWRALKNKTAGFSFHIADVALVNEKPAFVNKGEVAVRSLGREKQNGKRLLKYAINGPGLQNRGGHIWVNPQTFMIELYRIDLPDEEGFVNGQLKLLKTEKLSPEAWEKRMLDKVSGH